MKKKVLTMALLIINTITLNAQTTSLSLYVRDAIFNRPLAGVHVQILSPDSLLVDTCEMIRLDMGVKKDYLYVCEFPNKNPYFLLKLSKKGFDTEIVRVESAREVTPPPVLLRKTPIQLDSAIVRASKIMMVMHGDTIVYNADVFELSEGSMLDALMEQLRKEILEPTLAGFQADGLDFRGVLFIGLMISKDGPKVIEFNNKGTGQCLPDAPRGRKTFRRSVGNRCESQTRISRRWDC